MNHWSSRLAFICGTEGVNPFVSEHASLTGSGVRQTHMMEAEQWILAVAMNPSDQAWQRRQPNQPTNAIFFIIASTGITTQARFAWLWTRLDPLLFSFRTVFFSHKFLQNFSKLSKFFQNHTIRTGPQWQSGICSRWPHWRWPSQRFQVSHDAHECYHLYQDCVSVF